VNLHRGISQDSTRNRVGFVVLVHHLPQNAKLGRPRQKSEPRHKGGVRMPILLVIPHLVRTLAGGRTRYRLWCHGNHCKHEGATMQPGILPAQYVIFPVGSRRWLQTPNGSPSTTSSIQVHGGRSSRAGPRRPPDERCAKRLA
jgi:hypothetical protein